ncbi:PREDICTED: E3 ubiquitin-protein ligase RDUF1-like [Camelina sativa]|uniref:RING-type E3 ubiquitin transferase n=1 Tax=Camelina sativa TaxID=90675 RepID=A0ABM0Y5F1_CAMSA|nr:PREDICTED: E3 ubiquitin-protein ligase RDUF1-like [Camelina sativa]
MSSENDFAEFESGSDGVSRFLPLILAITAKEAAEDADQPTTIHAHISMDPLTPSVVTIGFGPGLEDFLGGGGKEGRSPASKASVESMPRVVIGEDNKGKGSCAICLEEWSKGDVATEMPCKHRFHSKCVEEWLGMHATCPMCRYEMPVEQVRGGLVGDTPTLWIGFSVGGRRGEED